MEKIVFNKCTYVLEKFQRGFIKRNDLIDNISKNAAKEAVL